MMIVDEEYQKRVILIVPAGGRFYLRLPGYMPAVVDALKDLIPYEDRHPTQGLGWMADLLCWAFSYDDYADVMSLLQQLLPTVPAEEVAEMPPFDRTKPYEEMPKDG